MANYLLPKAQLFKAGESGDLNPGIAPVPGADVKYRTKQEIPTKLFNSAI
jgi:hypothetical protein